MVSAATESLDEGELGASLKGYSWLAPSSDSATRDPSACVIFHILFPNCEQPTAVKDSAGKEAMSHPRYILDFPEVTFNFLPSYNAF